MRLLHAITLEPEEVISDKVLKYAILSHTWENEEVSFQDLRRPEAKGKAGYAKIKHCAYQAATDRLEYVWVDTCCIDKSSGAELSEAINSMYRWYQNADVCYAYLADVSPDENPESDGSTFSRSRWFTRGWTLQELIAPSDLVFYATDWRKIGTRFSLEDAVSKITGIDYGTIQGEDPGRISVARRMSWASRRKTTRVEDTAYCLMGLFGINMPMIYGEGEKAFLRLQEEIIKQSDDQSLFAWTGRNASAYLPRGLLAASPADFVDSHDIEPFRNWRSRDTWSMTNKGLDVKLPLLCSSAEDRVFLAGLDCRRVNDIESDALSSRCWIYLRQLISGGNQYARVKSNTIRTFDLDLEVGSGDYATSVLIRQTPLVCLILWFPHLAIPIEPLDS